MIKVLVISHSNAFIGGAPKSLSLLARELVKKGCSLTIACNSRDVADFYTRNGQCSTVVWGYQPIYPGKVAIGWSKVSSFDNLKALLKDVLSLPLLTLRQMRWIRRESPDIVHLNSAILIHSAIAAKLCGVPVVWHIREGGLRGIRRWFVGRLMRLIADTVICISPAEKSSFFLEDWPKARVVYNPIDFDHLNPERVAQQQIKADLGFAPDDFVVLTLGGANPRKGAAEIIESLLTLPKNVKALFAGPPFPTEEEAETSYDQRMLKAIRNHPGRVYATGNVEDVAPLLAACDALVFAGTTPHFPRPVYEAWAMKKPTIVFRTPGMEDNVSDGIDGILVNEMTGDSLAKAIGTLVKDPELCKMMGETGFRKSRERMKTVVGAQRVYEIYRHIVGQVQQSKNTN